MSTTLLEYLTQPNLHIDPSNLIPGGFCEVESLVDVEGTRPWPDFTYQSLMDCFRDILESEVPESRLARPPPIRCHLLSIRDEPSFECLLDKAIR
jgi:hypothetical protein